MQIVKRYIAALNNRDAEAAAALFADNFRLVDSTGGSIQGREKAIAAIRAFFDLEREFHLGYEEITVRGDLVLVRGHVQASDRRLRNDTLWEARVENGKLVHWQSFGKGRPLPLAKILKASAKIGAKNEMPGKPGTG